MGKIGDDVAATKNGTAKNDSFITPEILFRGTLSTLTFEFLSGQYAGQKYSMPGERTSEGRFIVYPRTKLRRLMPQEVVLGVEESALIISFLRLYPGQVVFR